MRRRIRWSHLIRVALVLPLSSLMAADAANEMSVKRQEVFEFVQKPVVTGTETETRITFESKAFCDATVAIEDAKSNIVRHLASGVLGANAPAPFQKNQLKQELIWDGKDDQGEYLKNRAEYNVRVSLGLKPQFERTLFWSPKKRLGFSCPVLRVAPEGLYVAESCEVDQVRLFDHKGQYVRTVYPFPADKISAVQGLQTHTFIQDGKTLPLKRGYTQATLLTCKSGNYDEGGITAIAAANGRVALTDIKLNRLSSDGSSGGLPFTGPQVGIPIAGAETKFLSPLSTAISADGKWLYLCGYHANGGWAPHLRMNGVMRMPFDGSEAPTLFAGELKQDNPNNTTEAGKFRMATSVACDPSGRVYVTDYLNDRVQVFGEDGKLAKSIPVSRPVSVSIHQKTGDIYVFSWMMIEQRYGEPQPDVEPTMTHLGPFDNPAVKLKCPLPLPKCSKTTSWNVPGGYQFRVDLDSWTEKPTIWTINGSVGAAGGHDDGSTDNPTREFEAGCVVGYEEDGGKLVPKFNFAEEAIKSVTRLTPPILWRQRLITNPVNGKVYVAEGDSGVMKSVNQLVEITPETGKIALVDLPMGAEDLCFDKAGMIYLRTDTMVGRFDPTTWREIPWDYGEERDNHSFGMGATGYNLTSGLPTPGHRSFNFWQLGGMDVSVKGHLVITTCNGAGLGGADVWKRGEAHFKYEGKPYTPAVYPGRMRWGEIHIFDKHGKLVISDAVPGMTHLDGIGIDQDDNLYMMTTSRRIINGKNSDPKLENDASCTLVKAQPGKVKVISSGGNAGGSGSIPVPLPSEAQPTRSMDLAEHSGGVTGWVENADWLFGGVGYGAPGAGGCICWNSRFSKDYFNRSIAPEPLHDSVAIVDGGGNLILRIGTYGNVDDGKPLIPDGGPQNTHSIGGDETALHYACYVSSDTDHRVFIADAGNARILSVKLNYHAQEIVPLAK